MLRKSLFLVALFLAFTSSIVAASGQWTTVRPPGGIANQFLQVGDQIWMRGQGGLHTSAEDGMTWSRHAGIGDVATLAASPHDSGLLLAGGSSTIFRSVDGGATWGAIDLPRVGVFGDIIGAITFDAVDSNRVYAAAEGVGLYTSDDRGATWAALSTSPAMAGVLQVVAHPSIGGQLYTTGTTFGVRRSTDGGANWTALDTGLSDTYITTLVVDTTDPSMMYAGNRSSWRVYRTTDAGALWTVMSNGLPTPGSGVSTTDIKPGTAPGIWYVTFDGSGHHAHTGNRVFKTTDGGDSWAALSPPVGARAPQTTAIHPDPSAPGHLLIGTRLGNYFSDDDGASWTEANNGFNAVAVSQFAVNAAGQLLASSRFSGLHRSSDAGVTWERLLRGVAEGDYVATAVSPHQPEHIAASRFYGPYVSQDGGNTWNTADHVNMVLGALAFDPTDPQSIYAIRDGGATFLRSTDGGGTWSERATGAAWISSSVPTRIASPPASPGMLFFNHHTGLYRSVDFGESWTLAHGNLPSASTLMVAVHPDNSGVVYASFGAPVSGAYRSDDSGETWHQVWLGTPLGGGALSALAFDASDPYRMLAATANAVYGSIDGGANWRQLSEGLNTSSQGVLGLAFDPAREARYFVVLGNTFRSNLQTYSGAIAADAVVTAQLTASSVVAGNDTLLQGEVGVVLGYDATEVVVEVAVPGVLAVQGATFDGDECDTSGNPVRCTAARIPRGEARPFELLLRGSSTGTGQITVTATPKEHDPVTANNTVSMTITVTVPPTSSPPNPPPQGGKSGGGSFGWWGLLPGVAFWRRRRGPLGTFSPC